MIERQPAGRRRRAGRQDRELLPDDPVGRGAQRHAAGPRRQGRQADVRGRHGAGVSPSDVVVQPHHLRAGRQRARHPGARGRPVLGPRLQHREPHRRRDRRQGEPLAHHHRDQGHADDHRADQGAARPAGAGASRARPHRRGPAHRARAGAGQGQGHRRQARRGAAPGRRVPRQGDRRQDRFLRLRGHRHVRQGADLRRPDGRRSAWSMSAAPASSPCRAAARRCNRGLRRCPAGPGARPSAGRRQPRSLDRAGDPDRGRRRPARRAAGGPRHDGGRARCGRPRRCSACRRCSPASTGSTSPSASAARSISLYLAVMLWRHARDPLPEISVGATGAHDGLAGLPARAAAAAQQSQDHGVLRQHLPVVAAAATCRPGWTARCWPSWR